MTKTYTYDATYEQTRGDIVMGSVELRFKYTCTQGHPAPIDRIEGRRMDPDNPPEIQIVDIFEECLDVASNKYCWVLLHKSEFYDECLAWAEEHLFDEMVASAGDDDEGDADAAADAAAERAIEAEDELERERDNGQFGVGA